MTNQEIADKIISNLRMGNDDNIMDIASAFNAMDLAQIIQSYKPDITSVGWDEVRNIIATWIGKENLEDQLS